jgi:hypothetical protein
MILYGLLSVGLDLVFRRMMQSYIWPIIVKFLCGIYLLNAIYLLGRNKMQDPSVLLLFAPLFPLTLLVSTETLVLEQAVNVGQP